MKRILLTLLSLFLFATTYAAENRAANIIIGTGPLSGAYYPTGGALCKIINANSNTQQLNCKVEASEGSVANIEDLKKGKINFALIQSDWQYHAYNGSSVFNSTGANRDLRAVYSLYAEAFTVVVRANSTINNLGDLKGKRINIGAPNSGQRATIENVITALGWHNTDFKEILELDSDQQIASLCDGKIDAALYTIGHPNDLLKQMALTCPVRLVTIDSTMLKNVMASNPFFVPMTIPGHIYKGNNKAIDTFGVKATLVTTKNEPEWIVNKVVKDTFDHLTELKRLHPALAHLQAKSMLLGNSAPFADGALKYYKDNNLILDLARRESLDLAY